MGKINEEKIVKSVVGKITKLLKKDKEAQIKDKDLLEDETDKTTATVGLFGNKVIGPSSKKSIDEFDFNKGINCRLRKGEESDDWKYVTCDLMRALYEWKTQQSAEALAWLSAYKQKIAPLVEGTSALGGYLVPTETLAQIEMKAKDTEVLYPYVRKLRMTRNAININSEASRPRFTETGESSNKTSTSIDWSQTTLTAYKAAAILVGSDELFADANIDVMDYIIQQFADAMAEWRDDRIMNGTGSSQISGIDSYTFTQVDAAGALTGDHLIKALYEKLKSGYRGRASWIMSGYAFTLVQTLKTTTNEYILSNLREGASPTILGRPVLVHPNMLTDSIFVGDLSRYILGVRQELTFDVSNEATFFSGTTGRSLWQRDETGIRAVVRYGGILPLTEAFVEIVTIS